jgi:hypothetical protein
MITMPILLTIATIAGGTIIGQKINGLFGGAKTSGEKAAALLSKTTQAERVNLVHEALNDTSVKAALAAHDAA